MVRRRGAVLAAGVLVVVFVAAAALVGAWSATSNEVVDSGVWVASGDQIGRLNSQIAQIDFARDVTADGLAQDGRDVYLLAGSVVSKVDVADPRADLGTVEVPGAEQLAAGGGTAAVLTDVGDVHVVAAGGELVAAGEPAMELGANAELAVGIDGTVVGYAPEARAVYVLAPGAREAEEQAVPDLGEGVDLGLAGDRPVLLGTTEGSLLVVGDDPIDVSDLGDELRLGQPVTEDDQALVASSEQLAWVSLGDGSVDAVADGGTGAPGRPIQVDDCVGVAWAGPARGRAVISCEGSGLIEGDIESEGAQARPGGPTVVFDARSGPSTWVTFDGELREVAEWPVDDTDDQVTEEYQEQVPDRTTNVAPVAEPDEQFFKGRVGSAPVFDVMWNDHDKNQDPLVIVEVTETTMSGVTTAVVRGGRGIEVDLTTVPPESVGQSVSFSYRVSDGQVRSEPAQVTVEVVDPNTNSDPKQKGAAEPTAEGEGSVPLQAEVEVGRSVRTEVVAGFVDPEGDAIALADVELGESSPHRVRLEPGESGFTFAAGPAADGASVDVAVRDARGGEADATVDVSISGQAPLAPHPNNDLVVGVVERELVIEPLRNDTDGNGDALTLGDVAVIGEVPAVEGQPVLGEVGVEPGESAVRVTPLGEGLAVLHYHALDNAGGDRTGVVLVNVLPANTPPIVLPDVVVVEPGGTAAVDLLANDLDVDGDLLAVSDLRDGGGRADPGVVAHVQDHRTLSVDAFQAVHDSGEVGGDGDLRTYRYSVTDGASDPVEAEAVVLVQRLDDADPTVPVALDPEVDVQVGDVVTVPVAALVWDPDGDVLDVELDGERAADLGAAFMSGEDIRFRAGPTVGLVEIPYTVSDPTFGTDTGVLRVDVRESNGNEPPEPVALEARVVQGATVVIPVPLVGIDPDGDSVRVVGPSPDPLPERGTVDADPQLQALTYTAHPEDPEGSSTPGPDEFEYAVVDHRGKLGTAVVRVVVLAAPENRPPVAVPDRLAVAPERTIYVDPSANDADLDGDALQWSIDVDAVNNRAGYPEVAVVDDGRLLAIDAPDDGGPGLFVLRYNVSDGRGMPVEGIVVVEVRDGAGLAPVARDDYPTVTSEATVTVPVLDNDVDPDGGGDCPMTPSIDDPEAEPGDRVDGSDLVLEVHDAPRLVLYRATDCTERSAQAIVWVPGRKNRPPTLRPGAFPIEVQAGSDGFEVSVDALVEDPDGEVQLSRAASPDADGSRLQEQPPWFVPLANAEGASVLILDVFDTLPGGAAGEIFSLTVPVEITPPENRPPRWREPLEVFEFDNLLAAPQPYELEALVHEPDSDDLTFTLDDSASLESAGVDVVLDEASGALTLTRRAGADVAPGRHQISVAAADATNDPVAAEVQVEIVPTELGPPVANPDQASGEQGKPIRIDVVANDEAPGDASRDDLRVVSAEVVSGDEAGRVDPDGGSATTIVYTPGPDTWGTVMLEYVLGDGTTDPSRQRTAEVEVTVIGRPSPPTVDTVTPNEASGVMVGWKGAQPNGAEIVEYQVRSLPDVKEFACTSECLVTPARGLVAGKPYQFEVRARNAVGWSEWSDKSAPVTPDALPPAVVPRVRDVAGTKVTFEWDALPADDGYSAVQAYLVEVEGRGGEPMNVASRTSVELEGTPKEQLCVRVVAVNARGTRDFDGERACGNPYGPPRIELELLTVKKREVTVKWSIDPNGADRAVTATFEGACSIASGEPGPDPREGQTTFDCPPGVQDITLKATTRSTTTTGSDLTASESLEVEPYDAPVIRTVPQVTPGAGRVTLAPLNDVDWGRSDPDTHFWRYSWTSSNGTSHAGELEPWDTEITGLPAWTTVTLSLSACNDPDSCRSAVDVADLPIRGVPSAPTAVSASWAVPPAYDVTYTWQPHPDSTVEEHVLQISGAPDPKEYVAIVGSGPFTVSFAALYLDDALYEWPISVRVCNGPESAARIDQECSGWVNVTLAPAVIPPADGRRELN